MISTTSTRLLVLFVFVGIIIQLTQAWIVVQQPVVPQQLLSSQLFVVVDRSTIRHSCSRNIMKERQQHHQQQQQQQKLCLYFSSSSSSDDTSTTPPDASGGNDSNILSSSSIPTSSKVDDEHVHVGLVDDTLDNPCWQDIYDGDDCVMSTYSSANFIPQKWIKSMPCADGIEDCDMEEVTTHPGYDGIDDVDVMNMLGIKRAKNLEEKKTETTEKE